MDSITFGILTVSDTCAADRKKDVSGPEAERLVTSPETVTGAILKGRISCKDIVPDKESVIMKTLIEWADKDNVNVVLTTGGTGFSERDVTPEATRQVIDKEAPGISLAMFNKSLQLTPKAMLSRAVCGIRGKTLIINLPGSPKAVAECLNTVAPVIPHAVALILDDKRKISKDHSTIQATSMQKDRLSKCRDLEIRLGDVANRLRESPYPMVDFDYAKKMIERHTWPLYDSATGFTNREFVSADQAHGRILATAVYSPCDLPPFRASIKDGYAVIAKDGRGSRKVLGGMEAGHKPGSINLSPGNCVRVNTGAPVPDGATAVVQVEDTDLPSDAVAGKEETSIEILVKPKEGQDIRSVGSDIKKGAQVLDAYTKVGAVEMGVLAACGITKVEVTKIPIIGILSTGNELQVPGEPLKPGHVYDSNKITLIATLKESGYNCIDLGLMEDDMHATIAGIERALNLVDVLITTGSVSMGDKDMLKPIIKEIFGATIHFGRVNLKPGKPTTFATCEYNGKNKYFLCLPGNPVSAMVTAHLFAKPLVHRLAGNFSKPTIVTVQTTRQYDLDVRPEYARVILKWDTDDRCWRAYSTGDQISSKLLSCKGTNALLILPAYNGKCAFIQTNGYVQAMLLGYDINPLVALQDEIKKSNV